MGGGEEGGSSSVVPQWAQCLGPSFASLVLEVGSEEGGESEEGPGVMGASCACAWGWACDGCCCEREGRSEGSCSGISASTR